MSEQPTTTENKNVGKKSKNHTEITENDESHSKPKNRDKPPKVLFYHFLIYLFYKQDSQKKPKRGFPLRSKENVANNNLGSERRPSRSNTDKSITNSVSSHSKQASERNKKKPSHSFCKKQSDSKKKFVRRDSNQDLTGISSSAERGRQRSRSFEVTRRSDSRSNSAVRKTPKIINDSVEKEITTFF